MYAIVPDFVENAINARIDEAIEKWPQLKAERYGIYHDLLDAYGETGEIAEITLADK